MTPSYYPGLSYPWFPRKQSLRHWLVCQWSSLRCPSGKRARRWYSETGTEAEVIKLLSAGEGSGSLAFEKACRMNLTIAQPKGTREEHLSFGCHLSLAQGYQSCVNFLSEPNGFLRAF